MSRTRTQRVSQATALRHWLRLEARKRGVAEFDPDELSEREALDRLLDCKPGAAAFVWRDAPIQWWRTTLSRREFVHLRVVEGPDDLLWRSLSPDGRILGAAERIAHGDPNELVAETGVDVHHVLDLRDALREDGQFPLSEPLVLSKREGCEPPAVADGNYRATAHALRVLQTGEYEPVEAFLGVGRRPVLEPIRQRACEVVRRVRSPHRW